MKTVALGEVTDSVRTSNPMRGEGSFTYIDLSAIDQELKSITNAREMAAAEAPSRARQIVSTGDVLVSTVRPNLNGVAWVPPELDGATASTGFCVLRPKQAVLDARYLFHWVRDERFVDEMVRRSTGASYPAVSDAIVKHSAVLLPPIEEQRRIAAILDKVGELRAKRRAVLAHVDSLTQSIFLDMFGDPATNTQRLPTARLDSICRLVRGSSPRPQGDPRYFGGPVRRLMVSDLTRDGLLVTPRIDSLTLEGAKRSRPVPASTIVMAVSGNVGVVSQLAVDACIHDGFVAFTLLDESRVRPLFLLYALHLSRSVHRKNTAGAIFQNLTTTDINRLDLVVPSIASQDTFIERLAAVRNMTEKLSMTVSALDSLLASLQQRAFSGTL